VTGWHPDGTPEVEVEGLFAQRRWVRERAKKSEGKCLDGGSEAERWGAAFEGSGGPPGGCRWTLVADREADIFDLIADCRRKGVDFVIRAAQPRRLLGREGSPLDAAAGSPALGRFDLMLRARPGQPARRAVIEVRSVRVALRPPRNGAGGREVEPVTVVEAREVGAPEGVEPVEWVLLTSWRVESLRDAVRVVKTYVRRWLIEEYHKALKTGAGIERSQLETRERLEALLGLLAVVAVRLLGMKLAARSRPDEEPAAGPPGPEVLRALEAEYGRPAGGWTNRSVLVSIARLGGFLACKSDGDWGSITIRRGRHNLTRTPRGVEVLREQEMCAMTGRGERVSSFARRAAS
jgi:hypothetical protein